MPMLGCKGLRLRLNKVCSEDISLKIILRKVLERSKRNGRGKIARRHLGNNLNT